jgi:hypothetical protein
MKKYRLKVSLLVNVILVITVITVYFPKIEKLLINHYNIVFFGDSFTQNGNWRWLLKRIDIKKSGNPGFTTSHLLWIIKEQVLIYHPDTCYIQGGMNDIGVGVPKERTIENYKQLIGELKLAGVTPIVQSILYSVNDTAANKKVTVLNSEMLKYARRGILNLLT